MTDNYYCVTDSENFPNFTKCLRQCDDESCPNTSDIMILQSHFCVFANSGKGRRYGWQDPCPTNSSNCQDPSIVGENCGSGHTDDKVLCYELENMPNDKDCKIGFGTFNSNDDLKFASNGLPNSCTPYHGNTRIMDCTLAYESSGCSVDRDNKTYTCPGEKAEFV